MQIITVPVTSSDMMLSREAALYLVTRAPRPCFPRSCANIADAASSSGPLPARHRTGAAPCHGAESADLCGPPSGAALLGMPR